MPPPGAKGPAYIAPPNKRGPSDQTDLNRMVFLNPLGRWSMIREAGPDWPRHLGGRPLPGPTRPLAHSRGFWTLLDDRKSVHTLISLCKLDLWAFPPYFLITPCRNRQTPKLVKFCQIKPQVWVLVAFGSFSLFI